MKMNARINKDLYRDGLRQLRLVGIMGMVVFCLAAILTAVGFYITSPANYEIMDINGIAAIREIEETGISLYQCNWVLFLSFPILTPILTMMMFNFLNHRNASDFYHSIPDTRGTLYLSYCAAVMTWVLAIIGVSSLLAVGMISMIPGYFVIWSTVPKALFMMIASCALVMGGMMIAKGLTGTLMSNLAVSLMLLFLPRVFITVTTWILSDTLNFVAWNYSPSLLNPRYNLVAGLVFCVFTGINPLDYWTSGVYTLVLGLIYLAVGYVVFTRRKSESAGNAAISRRLQSIFRLALSLTVCLIPIYLIVYNQANRYNWNSEEVFLIIVVYVIAVLAYFIYELVTTGKLKRFGSLCKGLVVLAGLNVLVFGVIWGVYYSVVSYQPDAEDIDYVTIVGDEDDYFQNQLNRMKIDNDEVTKIVAVALKRTISSETGHSNTTLWETAQIAEKEYYTETIVQSADKIYSEQLRTVYQTVAINCGLKTVYREIEFTGAEWDTIAEYLSNMSEYRQVFWDLPDGDKVRSIFVSNGRLTNEQAKTVYEVMCQEVKEIDFAEWYVGVTDVWGKDYLDIIRVSTEIGDTGRYQTVRLPVLDSMTKTIDCYFQQMSSESVTEEEKESWAELQYVLENGYDREENQAYGVSLSVYLEILNQSRVSTDEVSFSVDGYSDGDKWYQNRWGHLETEKEEEKLIKLVNKLYDGEYTMESTDGPLLIIDMNGYVDLENGGTSIDKVYCVSITEELQGELEELLGYSLEEYLTR